ncbi:D-alanine--D-alanine ligase, partial [Candidatus Saccharibacteria bacterium]|nr:D-alanine--D-alanine ligase [Candidatus Saccharibacteria bacterium]
MQKTIAVFFGGRSTEHDISIITALSSVIKPLELTKKYTVVPVYIAKDGKWFSDEKLKNISLFRGKAIDDFCAKTKPLAVVFDGGMVLRKVGLKNKDIRVDIAFPAMHGPYGEDGSLMGLLRMAGIPFVGSDMSASVIAMDKVLAKQVARANDIPTSKFVSFSKAEFEASQSTIIEKATINLTFPQFVKPAHLGSSIGITKVNNSDELLNAIEVAAYYDDKIIVEEAVENLIEVTVPIMGNETLQPALVEQPLSHGDDFFDFDTKYMKGGKKSGGAKQTGSQGYSELPAKLPDGLYKAALDVAQKVYLVVGCEGISRIDLLIDTKSETVYFNEINPLP